MHSGGEIARISFGRISLWVGKTVMKTLLLAAGILLASALIGFSLFTSANAGAPAAALSITPDLPGKKDRVQESPAFKIVIEEEPSLSGLYRPDETVFVPPMGILDIRNLAAGEGRFTTDAAFSKTKCKQTLDALDHASFVIKADPGATFQIQFAADFKLNVVVLYPAKRTVSKTGDISIKVNDKVLGTLKDPRKCGSKLVKEHVECFVAPAYFVRITEANRDWQITSHLKLGQMVAPATRWVNNKKVFTNERHTEYFVPNRPLAEKLELVAVALEAQGIRFTEWEVNSGYRTPAYNHSIGGATFSQHIWGDAVDVMIDCDKNHRMDDINKDGKADRNDGILIAKIADKLEMDGKAAKGGIGVYQFDSDESVACHVHIDTRGYVVRWGQFGIGRSAKGFTWWPETSYSPTGGGGE